MSIPSKNVVLGMLRKYILLCLVNEVYHISVVNAIKSIRKGGVKLYKKFAELLEKTNKTAYQISKDTGIAQSVLSDWKNGRSNPNVDKIKILADYFGVSIDYFLDDTKECVQ